MSTFAAIMLAANIAADAVKLGEAPAGVPFVILDREDEVDQRPRKGAAGVVIAGGLCVDGY